MQDIKELLYDCFLFKGIGVKEIKKCLESTVITIESFKKGDTIYSPECFDKRLGIILLGEC